MWEEVRPDWAAMSRKMGTGSVTLRAGDFFSVGAGGSFAAGPVGPWGVLWADSRPVKAIHKIIICPTLMQSDCSAIGSSAAVSAAVFGVLALRVEGETPSGQPAGCRRYWISGGRGIGTNIH